jgi:hypothetical protein
VLRIIYNHLSKPQRKQEIFRYYWQNRKL